MRALLLLAVFLFATGFVASGCKRDKCLPTCEQRAKELKCPHPNRCKDECEDLRKRTVCRAELDTFAACFLKEPKEHWICDEEGKPSPNMSYCVKERSAVAECLQKAFSGPNPPKTL